MRRSEQREHIFKLLFMTQFNSEDEMSDQVSMYFETIGELEEKDQEAMQAKYQHILEHLEEIDQTVRAALRFIPVETVDQVFAEVFCPSRVETKADAIPAFLPVENSKEAALRQ